MKKTKTQATGAAPPDDRKVLPLSQEEIDAPKKVDDERERKKIHRILLTESLRRLRAGRHVERAHGVIHPEMTAITRDVLRLTDLVFPGQGKSAASLEGGDEAAPELNAGAAKLCELLERAPLARVARMAATDPALLKRHAEAKELPDEAKRVVYEARLRIARGLWDEKAGAA